MTNYVKIAGGVVVQKQPYGAPGFVAAPDDVVCGMLYDGQGFSNPPPASPQFPVLLPFQFFAMLELSGRRPQLDAFIAVLPQPERTVARAKIEYSLSFHRDNELVLVAQAGLGLSHGDLDTLWLQASQIA